MTSAHSAGLRDAAARCICSEVLLEKVVFPGDFLRHHLHASPENWLLVRVTTHEVEPRYEYDDRVFVDTSDVRPSPAGVFLYWNGVAATLGNLQVIPRKGEPLVRISREGDEDRRTAH